MTAREAAEDCTSLVPKVNNEWTVDGDFIRAGSNLLLSIKAIVDAHKSALAAEREQVRFKEREGIARLHQAVVKAQDDRTYVERLYHDQEKEVQQLHEQLNNLERVSEAWEEDAKRYATNSNYYRDQLAALKETQGKEFTDLQHQLTVEQALSRGRMQQIERHQQELIDQREKVERQEHYIKHLEACVENMPKGMGDLTREWLELREQLAAERESKESSEKNCDLLAHEKQRLHGEMKQLREQLAEHIKASNEVTDENIELEQKLATAQAAIAKHNSGHPKGCRLEYTDTTALEAAITEERRRTNQEWNGHVSKLIADHKQELAAAQQPLVECLTWLREELKADEYYVEKIDIAFAKMKKGKV